MDSAYGQPERPVVAAPAGSHGGLWNQALATGAVFVNPYDAANIADARRNLADSLSLEFTYSSRLADLLEPAFARRTAAEWERFLAAYGTAGSIITCVCRGDCRTNGP